MPAGAFRFLHAADLHLDSPLRGLVRYPGAPAERLQGATRAAFSRLIDLALEREVAFVIVAGDVFDGDWPDYSSGLWFNSEVRRLAAADIPLFLLRGNHDAASRVTRALALPEGVMAFPTDAPATKRLERQEVALHGQSFAEQHVYENLARAYPAPVPGWLNIGVLHTGLEGYEGHGVYAPCTLSELVAKGYDYWALGHIHQRQVLHTDPWVVFPGNLQGRHARELGPKGATLVHVEAGRITALEELACDVARWTHARVDVSGCTQEATALAEVKRQLEVAVDEADGRLIAARVTLTGATPLDTPLRAARERIVNEVRALGLQVSSELWVEKVLLETSGRAAAGEDTVFDVLAARIQATALSGEDLLELGAELQGFNAKLPASVAERLAPTAPATLERAAARARRLLAALLADSVKDGQDSAEGLT